MTMISDGNPLTRAYTPPIIEASDYSIHVILFNNSCFMYRHEGKFEYLDVPDTEGVEVCVSYYYRPKKTPGARVSRVIFDAPEWDEDTAIQWVYSHGLELWEGYKPRNI